MQCTLAVLAFLPFFLAPGFLVGYSFDLLHFRDSDWGERLLLSVTLSVAVLPIFANLIGRLFSLDVVCWIVLVGTAVCLVLVGRELHRESRARVHFTRETKIAVAIVAGWAAVAIALSIDLHWGDALYVPMQSFDQSVRSSLAASAVRTGVPPANPFFFPGHPVALRYYYYWNVLCALPAKLFGLNARATTLAAIVWSGLALAASVPLYLKYFCEETVELARKSLLGVALIAVTGLDLIPTVLVFKGEHMLLPDMEWWDGQQQVTSWIDSLLWVPHHVAAVVACLTGLLVLWVVQKHSSAAARLVAATVAGAAFASAAGLSVYVTFTFGIFLVVWTLVLFRSKLWQDGSMFVLAGVITVLLSLFYLHDLRQPGYSGSLYDFYVRALDFIDQWADEHVARDWVKSLLLAACLPVYYTIEFGVFALFGFVQAHRFWRKPGPLLKWEWASLSIAGVSLLVGSFLRSTTGNNDLGYRSLLFAQFILLLWAVPSLHRWKTNPATRTWKLRLLFQTFLWVGVLGTLYQITELRVYTILAGRTDLTDELPWLPNLNEPAKDMLRARQGFEELRKRLPDDAVVQYNPTNPAYVPNLYYARMQSVDGMATCGTAFGGDPFLCMQYQNKINAAFSGRVNFSVEQADALCQKLKIDVLVAERSDRMWSLRRSWIWSAKPIVENGYLRAVACGKRKQQIESLFSSAESR